MGFPLTDITVYYAGEAIKNTPEDWAFRKEVNYISDFYHNRLEKYKPPKTSRICIHASRDNTWREPNHFGSICSFEVTIDERKYLSLIKNEKYKYLLDLIHNATLEVSKRLKWESEPFRKPYQYILEKDFIFKINYPRKKSQDKRKTALTVLTKNEEQSFLEVIIEFEEQAIEKELVVKKNWWWYDSIYDMAQRCKWITKNRFGYISKDKKQFSFYDLEEDAIKCNLQLKKNDF